MLVLRYGLGVGAYSGEGTFLKRGAYSREYGMYGAVRGESL